tara:strand:- start:74 stop:820 length:747 start_codon:yes stop_codon:yes gene_type:complete
MKFTYWGGIRSGKMQIWQLFELNGKKTAISTISGKKWPAFFILYGGGDTSEIIYEENGKVKIKNHKPACIVDGVYDLKSDWGKDGIERYSTWSTDPQVLYKSFDKVFEQDLIVNPFLLLGYYGKIGTEDFNEMVERRQRNIRVDLDYTISELKKRRNIIPYKTDKVHEKYLFNMLDEEKSKREKKLKGSLRLTDLVEGLLTEYQIPFEKFDLDAALLNNDYSTLGLDKPLPKNILEEDMNAAQEFYKK